MYGVQVCSVVIASPIVGTLKPQMSDPRYTTKTRAASDNIGVLKYTFLAFMPQAVARSALKFPQA